MITRTVRLIIISAVGLVAVFATLYAFWGSSRTYASASINVCGPIISDTIWIKSQTPYQVTCNILVEEGVTLTIQPGVTVRFSEGTKLQVDGELQAVGHLNQEVIFTSGTSFPKPGDWSGIIFTDSSVDAGYGSDGKLESGSALRHCIVEYSGGDNATGYRGVLIAENAAPLIEHCQFRNNGNLLDGTSGRFANSIVAATAPAENPIKIRYNIFEDNNIFCCGAIDVNNGEILSNTISNNFALGLAGIKAGNSIIFGNILEGNQGDLPPDGVSAWNSDLADNTIVHNGGRGIIANSSTVRNNYIARNNGGGLAIFGGEATDNVVVGNNGGEGGGIRAVGGMVIGNNIIDNTAGIGGGVAAFEGAVVENNNIVGNVAEDGGGMLAQGRIIVRGNAISYNEVVGGMGSGILAVAGAEITHNTLVGNRVKSSGELNGGVVFERLFGESYAFHYNNVFDNLPYDIVVRETQNISGTNNYWGTTASINILDQIYDWFDDDTTGRFFYIPYLQDPDPDAPVPSPSNLRADWHENSVVLTWDPIPSTTTGYGYKVYYDTDAPGPPYDGAGLGVGSSPIDVGSLNSLIISDLGEEVFYATVTAYDTRGRESWYSNEVQRPIQSHWTTFMPVSFSQADNVESK